MFQRLSFNLQDIDINRLRGHFLEAYGPTFTQYAVLDEEYLNSMLSTRVRFHIPPNMLCFTEITDVGAPDPHTDSSMTALNYYITTSNCTTVFWRSVNPDNRTMIPRVSDDDPLGVSTTYTYDVRDLRVQGSFVAKNHEAYLLNTHQIHSVRKSRTSPHRCMIRWLWYQIPYEQVLKSIEIL